MDRDAAEVVVGVPRARRDARGGGRAGRTAVMSVKGEAVYMLKRLTSMRFRQSLKGRVRRLRSRAAPLIERWHGTYDTAALEAELRCHLPAQFEILMVHSSLADMRPMYRGSAQDVLNMLLRVVGPHRTLAMPAFFFGTPELYHRDFFRA